MYATVTPTPHFGDARYYCRAKPQAVPAAARKDLPFSPTDSLLLQKDNPRCLILENKSVEHARGTGRGKGGHGK
jgi:hypothetical protein